MSHYLLRQNAVDLQRSTQIGYKQIPRAKSRHIKKSRVECAWNNKNIPVSKNTQDDLSRACADFLLLSTITNFSTRFHLPLSKFSYFPSPLFPPSPLKALIFPPLLPSFHISLSNVLQFPPPSPFPAPCPAFRRLLYSLLSIQTSF